MKTFGIIMAGGEGTRFWPLSRKETPKQLLNISGNEVLINETIERLVPQITNELFIITNQIQVEKLKQAVSGRISCNHILVEPVSRNTAACIGYAAMKIVKQFGDAIMIILPSDSYVKDTAEYVKVLNIAVDYALKTDRLVTVGVTPTYPATGYGYIKYRQSEERAKPVEKFIEKPVLRRARQYFQSGEYVWNSGVFAWKASVILRKFEQYLPDIYQKLLTIGEAIGLENEREVLETVYPNIESISIDYGILEKTDDILVVPGEFGWSDVGSLDMMGVMQKTDENGNVIIGDVVQMDTANSIIYSKNKLVAAISVENLIIIDMPDVTLVCPADKAQDVKKLVEELKKQGRDDIL